nr:MAG TPA: hypothetical protein [Caudoviricetes sp.]
MLRNELKSISAAGRDVALCWRLFLFFGYCKNI